MSRFLHAVTPRQRVRRRAVLRRWRCCGSSRSRPTTRPTRRGSSTRASRASRRPTSPGAPARSSPSCRSRSSATRRTCSRRWSAVVGWCRFWCRADRRAVHEGDRRRAAVRVDGHRSSSLALAPARATGVTFEPGGWVGDQLAGALQASFNRTGSIIIILTCLVPGDHPDDAVLVRPGVRGPGRVDRRVDRRARVAAFRALARGAPPRPPAPRDCGEAREAQQRGRRGGGGTRARAGQARARTGVRRAGAGPRRQRAPRSPGAPR